MKYLYPLTAVLALFFFACTKDKSVLKKAPVAPPVSLEYCDSMRTNNIVSWKCDVDTIIKTYCALSSCHNNSPDFGPSQPNLTNYTEVSNFKTRVRERAAVSKDMPPSNATLFPPDSLREKIKKWIDAGANNN